MTARMTPFGERLRALRLGAGITQQQLAASLGFAEGYTSGVENGYFPASRGMAKAAVVVFGLEGAERDEFLALAPARPKTRRRRGARAALPVLTEPPVADVCDCSGHDGAMRPGGKPEDRDETCMHYDACLDAFDKAYPRAASAHCPPRCGYRKVVPRHIEQAIYAGARKEDV